MNRAIIIGTGACLPRRALTNADLEKMVDTSDEWITTRTGITTRYIAGPGENTSQLATKAARNALEMASLEPEELDLVIVATITPDMTMPSAACLVQNELGAVNAGAFDLNAACSGFIYGIDVAARYVEADPEKKILVVGAETMTSRVNWQDRNTCVLFGDGAGAAIISGSNNGSGLLASRLYADGSLWELLSMDAAPSLNPDIGRPDSDGSYIKMAGKDVFKYAVRAMGDAVTALLEEQDVSIDEIDLVIPHQANIRILKSLSDRLSVPLEKIYLTVQKYGNTSAASVPLSLDEVNRSGRLNKGDLVLFCVFGGGFTWGTALFRW